MIESIVLAVQSTVPATPAFNWNGSLIMNASCIVSLLILSRVIRYPKIGPKMPLPFPALFNNVSVPAFLACMSAGHLVGTGLILGLANLRIL